MAGTATRAEASLAAPPASPRAAQKPVPERAAPGRPLKGPAGRDAPRPPASPGFARQDQPEDAPRRETRQAGGTSDNGASTPPGDPPGTAAPGGRAAEIDAIRREGLTGRQLRMARRMALRHGLSPGSDIEAVQLLRARGIDPFRHGSTLELVVPAVEDADGARARQTLPQTVPNRTPATVRPMSQAEQREREIWRIRQDIVRRRRRKLALLLARLSFFVFLPTFLAGWYFYVLATPIYATDSEFLVLQNEGTGGGSGLGGLLPAQFSTTQDAIAVQSYLTSKDAMLRLDADEGFRAHFSQDWIDPIRRLEPDASIEEAHATYRDMVKLGFDPTEGVIRMEVLAADPATSLAFSEALIAYAEERVNTLSAQNRADQMRDATEALANAEADRRAAQEELVRLQIEGATLDPQAVISSLRAQVSDLEAQITQKEIELDTLLNNARPNRPRVDATRGTLDILRSRRDALEAEMTDISAGQNSLAQLSMNIQMAQADLATRDMMLQAALRQMEQARTEANRQVRYLTVAVRPVEPEEPTYPRAFENTALAFLVFAGIYLMVSLTAAILREQVST